MMIKEIIFKEFHDFESNKVSSEYIYLDYNINYAKKKFYFENKNKDSPSILINSRGYGVPPKGCLIGDGSIAYCGYNDSFSILNLTETSVNKTLNDNIFYEFIISSTNNRVFIIFEICIIVADFYLNELFKMPFDVVEACELSRKRLIIRDMSDMSYSFEVGDVIYSSIKNS